MRRSTTFDDFETAVTLGICKFDNEMAIGKGFSRLIGKGRVRIRDARKKADGGFVVTMKFIYVPDPAFDRSRKLP